MRRSIVGSANTGDQPTDGKKAQACDDLLCQGYVRRIGLLVQHLAAVISGALLDPLCFSQRALNRANTLVPPWRLISIKANCIATTLQYCIRHHSAYSTKGASHCTCQSMIVSPFNNLRTIVRPSGRNSDDIDTSGPPCLGLATAGGDLTCTILKRHRCVQISRLWARAMRKEICFEVCSSRAFTIRAGIFEGYNYTQ